MDKKIGVITDIENQPNRRYFIDFDGVLWQIDGSYIINYSKNKEDLEIILNSEKYNL